MMEIVACTDTHFIMPTGVMMYSVCVNNADEPITFHIVIDKGVTERQKDDLRKTVQAFPHKSVAFYCVDGANYEKLPKRENYPSITQATYYRLDLAKILPSDIDKVLYLDGDIICRKSLSALWKTDISQYAVAGVPDVGEADFEKDNHLHLCPWTGYFNAGVLLINLKWWREHSVAEEFNSFIVNHSEWIQFQDQDVLNYVFNEHKLLLPITYNLETDFLCQGTDYGIHLKEVMETIKDPTVLHFTTTQKPWKTSSRHPFRSSFTKYWSQTIWKDEPLQEDRPLKLRIIKFCSGILRKLKLIPELPPYSKHFLPNLTPLD